MRRRGLIVLSLFLSLFSLLADVKDPQIKDLVIHRYIHTRLYPKEANYRLQIVTVVANKKNRPIKVKIVDNVPQRLKLIRGNSIWEGKIHPEKDSYDEGYSGYELLIPVVKEKQYIIQPATVIINDNGKVLKELTQKDTVIFNREISDIWDRYDFYVNIPVDFYLENEMKDKHFLTFTGYPFDPRWIFIWWKDVKNEKINGKRKMEESYIQYRGCL